MIKLNSAELRQQSVKTALNYEDIFHVFTIFSVFRIHLKQLK